MKLMVCLLALGMCASASPIGVTGSLFVEIGGFQSANINGTAVSIATGDPQGTIATNPNVPQCAVGTLCAITYTFLAPLGPSSPFSGYDLVYGSTQVLPPDSGFVQLTLTGRPTLVTSTNSLTENFALTGQVEGWTSASNSAPPAIDLTFTGSGTMTVQYDIFGDGPQYATSEEALQASFSGTASQVPEPSTAILCIGAALIFCLVRMRHWVMGN